MDEGFTRVPSARSTETIQSGDEIDGSWSRTSSGASKPERRTDNRRERYQAIATKKKTLLSVPSLQAAAQESQTLDRTESNLSPRPSNTAGNTASAPLSGEALRAHHRLSEMSTLSSEGSGHHRPPGIQVYHEEQHLPGQILEEESSGTRAPAGLSDSAAANNITNDDDTDLSSEEGPLRHLLTPVTARSTTTDELVQKHAAKQGLYSPSNAHHGTIITFHALQEEANALKETLKRQFIRAVVEAGAALQRKIAPVQRSIARSSTINIFHTSSPVAAALSKRWFQLLLIILASSYYARVVVGTQALTQLYFTYKVYRFTALELRDGSTGAEIDAPHISNFGMLVDGCKGEEDDSITTNIMGASMIITYQEEYKINGFYFHTHHNGSTEKDPIRYRVEASKDGVTWDQIVGTSRLRITQFGEARYYDHLADDTPKGRNVQVKKTTQASWEWYFGWMLSDLLIGTGMGATCVCGLMLKENLGRWLFEFAWVVGAVARMVVAVSYSYRKDWRAAYGWWCWSTWALILPASLYLFERSFVNVVTFSGTFLVLVEVVNEYVIYDDPDFFMTHPPYLGFTMIGLGGTFIVFRQLIVIRSRRFIAEDKAVYDSVWETMMEEPEVRSELVELKTQVDDITLGIRSFGHQARQFSRQFKYPSMGLGESIKLQFGLVEKQKTQKSTKNLRQRLSTKNESSSRNPVLVKILNFLSPGSFTDSVEFSVPAAIDYKNPVKSLDQLFAQAAGMQPVLKAKVQDWALKTQGMFQLKNLRPLVFVRWEDAVHDEQMRKRIKWGEVKNFDRAIEKLLRSYKADVSRLCDLCRQQIVFEEIGQLIACLKLIAQDRSTILVRIKNRMESANDARMTAGFRSVVINLRIVTRETKRLGLETHVVELFLVLRHFAELQNEDAHQRYIQFRNNYPYKRQEPTHIIEDTVRMIKVASRKMSEFHPGGGVRRHSLQSSESLRQAESMRRLSLTSGESVKGGGSVIVQAETRKISVSPYMPGMSNSSKSLSREESVKDDSELHSSDMMETIAESEEGDVASFNSRLHRGHSIESPSNAKSVAARADSFDLQALFEAQFLTSTVLPHGTMEIQKTRVNDAMAHVSSNSVFFTSKAAVAAIGKLRWQVLMFVIATLYLSRGIQQTWSRSQETSKDLYTQFRFTALELRDGTLASIDSPHISSFGILQDGCQKIGAASQPVVEDNMMMIQMNQPMWLNGWYLITSNQSSVKDPVKFLLEATNDGQSWNRVGSSMVRFYADGSLKFLPGHQSVTSERSTRVEWDHRIPWPWVIAFPVVQLSTVVFAYIFIFCGIVGQSKYANYIIFAGFAITGGLQLISGIGYRIQGHDAESLYWILFSLSSLLICFVLAVAERYFIFGITVCGIYLVLMDIIKNYVLFDDSNGISASLPYTGMFFTGVGLTAFFFHAWILRRSAIQIESDRGKYDTVWNDMLSDDRTLKDIRDLTYVISRISKYRPAQLRQFNHKKIVDPMVQFNKPREAPMISRALSWVSASRQEQFKRAVTVNLNSPVSCLDQLFSQAAGMDLILRSKVQEWASNSRGCFQVKPPAPGERYAKPTFARWEEIREDPHLRHSVKWGQIKGLDRSIEKLLRSYGGDVSLLLDICRQCIVFEEIKDICKCVTLIGEDPDVAVARVKNRFDPEVTSHSTAGYRHVVLNLRVRSDLSKSLALETHVCEVQLLLRDFAQIKDEAHHGRYIGFRNARGE